jgi:hypothetical protein
MSHPDPLFDPENSYEEDDDMIVEHDPSDILFAEYLYDGHEDDYMDGDHDSAMTSCGWGTDEDYGNFGENDDDSFFGEDY